MTPMTSRLGLAALVLMANLPYLFPEHTTPIPSFYEESLAAILGLVASVALLGAHRLPLPGAALLALTLTAIVLVQAAVGRMPVPQLTLLFAMYLLWAALLACTGRHLAREFGLARLSRALAAAVLAGACLAALASLLQPWLQSFGWAGSSPRGGGPLAQANHLTSYLWLGLASALYLRSTAILSRRMFWVAATLLALTAVLVGQRSSFLYMLALIGVAAWQARGDGDKASLRLALKIGLLFLVLQPAAALLPAFDAAGAAPAPALRAARQVSGPSVRLQLWGVGAAGIGDAPVMGNGIGSYPGLALTHAEDIAPTDNPGPSEHGHNLFVDLGAELGLPAALLVLLGAGVWLRKLPQRAAASEAVWAAAVLAILGLHSMIEYPLWHSYFLGLLAVVAGAFGSNREIGGRLTSVALPLGLLLWGSVTLLDLSRDYGHLKAAHVLGKQPRTMPQATAELLRIPRTSLLAPWVNTTACVSLDPLRVALDDGLAVCRIAMVFAPTVESTAHMAALLWRNGDVDAARELLRRFRRASQYGPGELGALMKPLIVREPRLGETMKAAP